MAEANVNISSMPNSTIVDSARSSLQETNKYANEEVSSYPPQAEYSIFFEFVVPGILLNIIGLLGLIGNTLSIIVLSRPQMRQSINCILIGLASFDIILVVTSILMFGLPSVYGFLANYSQSYPNYVAPGLPIFAFYFYEVFPFITPTVYPIAMIVQTGSVYLTLAVTMERFVAVCLPFRARSLCTYGRARYAVILIAVFATVYNLPRFWEVYGKTVVYPEFNRTITNVEPTKLRNHPIYISVYITWAYLIFMYFIPFIGLAIFNLLIYRQVRIANLERSRMSRQEQKEIGLATMLMVVVIVFFICNILALIVNILEAFKQTYIQLNNLNNLLVTLNSSANFIIYCIFNDKFKRIFCKLFCCQMVLHKFGIYANDGGVGGGNTETYVHRYPDTRRRHHTTTTSLSGTLQHNIHHSRSITPRPGMAVENTKFVEGNKHLHLNNNGNSSNRGIEEVNRMNRISWGAKTLLENDDVMSDEDEYCSLTKDIRTTAKSRSVLQ